MICMGCGCDLSGSRSTRLRCSACKLRNDKAKEAEQRKVHPEPRNSRDRAYNATRKKIRKFGYNCHKSIKVVDVRVADPYYISKNELKKHEQDYAKEQGVTLYVNGKLLAIQEIMF